jgi:hypothetical protein
MRILTEDNFLSTTTTAMISIFGLLVFVLIVCGQPMEPFNLSPPSQTMIVEPGQRLSKSFITQKASTEKPSFWHLWNAKLLFVRRVKQRPEFLNYVARFFRSTDRKCEKIVCDGIKDPAIEISQSHLNAMDEQAVYGSRNLEIFGNKRQGYLATMQRRIHQLRNKEWHRQGKT